MNIEDFDLDKVVSDLIAYPHEEEWFEFKTNWYEAHQLGEYISAMSNAAVLAGKEYAFFVWGIEDDTHEVIGTKFKFNIDVKHEPLAHYLARQVKPDIGFQFKELEYRGKRLVVLVIPAAYKVPTAFDKVRYMRIGSSKVNLMDYPDRESQIFNVLTNGLPTIENTESEYQDLTFDKLFMYYAMKKVHINHRTFKKNLGLLTQSGKYNIMAQLLSDNSHIPIRFSIFNGTTKASTMYLVREFGNDCLLFSLDKILEYGEILNEPQADERNRKTTRDEVPLFNAAVYSEAVINAILHNRWIDGNAPMFTVFKNRIEILSRGRIAPKQTMEGFYLGESVPVNQKLSDMFLQLHISERSGRGVPKIVEAYGKEIIDFRENTIVVNIPIERIDVDAEMKKENKNLFQKIEKNERSLKEVLKEVLSTKDYEKVLPIVEYLEFEKSITPEKAERIIGKSSTTTWRYLKLLTDAGVIVAEGSTSNMKYRLVDERI